MRINDCFRIGFIGAGPVAQAIHLPVLATLGERWRVAKVMDIDAELAATVASRCAAAPTTQAIDIVADEDFAQCTAATRHHLALIERLFDARSAS